MCFYLATIYNFFRYNLILSDSKCLCIILLLKLFSFGGTFHFTFLDIVTGLCPGLTADQYSPIYTSHIGGITTACHYVWLTGGASLTFCPHWLQIMIILISTSRVDGIIELSHHVQSLNDIVGYILICRMLLSQLII
jgi:hypothetical protein